MANDRKGFMEEGQFLGLRFDDGFYFFRIMGKEMTNLKPYQIESALAAGATSTTWNTVQNSATDSREQISPTKEHKDQIYQIRYGVSPSRMQVYYQYISRQDRGSLVGTRVEGGAVGHIDGEENPFMEVGDNQDTNLFTIYERTPVFKAMNPTPSTSEVNLNFKIAKLYYTLINPKPNDAKKAKDIVSKIMYGDRRCTFSTMGMPGESQITAPTWLTSLTTGTNFDDISKW